METEELMYETLTYEEFVDEMRTDLEERFETKLEPLPDSPKVSRTINKIPKIRIAVFSHSNIALRQQKFWETFSKYAQVKVISPKVWNKLKAEDEKKGNYELIAVDTENTGNIYTFTFDNWIYKELEAWRPDIIYNQNEITAFSTIKTCKWAKDNGYRFVNFVWENLASRMPVGDSFVLNNSACIIAGNDKAKELHNAKYILPQVGIDTNLFKPTKEKKLLGAIFIGREVAEKGVEYIKQSHPPIHIFSNLNYYDVPSIMNQARVFVTYPYDTENWVEQFAPFSSIEAMACGLPVITSDAGSIRFWLEDSPAFFVQPQNEELLKLAIDRVLKDNQLRDVMSEGGRQFALRFDNDVIAKRLMEIFMEISET